MSILHAYHSKLPFRNIKGKPYITVSAKGISNGLSDTYNDGADFGPDTLLNATSKDQYGPPYTYSYGILEAWNYAVNNTIPYPSGSIRNNFLHKIVLGDGIFYISQPITLTAPFAVNNLNFEGQGMMPTYVGTTSGFPTTENMITIDPNILQWSNFTFKDIQFFGKCNTYLYADFSSSSTNANTNVLQLENVDISGSNWGTYSIYANALNALYANNFEDYSTEGAYFNGTRNAYIQSPFISSFALSISGFSNVILTMGTNLEYTNTVTGLQLSLSDIYNMSIGIFIPYQYVGIYVNGNVHNLDIGQIVSRYGATLFSTKSSSAVSIENLHIGTLNVSNNSTLTFSNSSLINFNSIDIHILDVESGSSLTSYPFQSTVNGTTAGTVEMMFTEYTPTYKKLVVTFNGYENDTTTNQTIYFPMPFSFRAAMSAGYGNPTVLTLEPSYMIIEAPNSTTTYTGLIIFEGY